MTLLKNFISTLVLTSWLCACGYTLRGTQSSLPPEVKKVYVPLVQNYSTEGNLSTTVTEALRDRFEQFGAFAIVDSAAEADAILEARILKVDEDTRSVASKSDAALQYATTMVVAAQLRRTQGGLLWKDQNITVSRSYGLTSDVIVTSSPDFVGGSIGANDLSRLGSREVGRGQQQLTLAQLAADVAERIFQDAAGADF